MKEISIGKKFLINFIRDNEKYKVNMKKLLFFIPLMLALLFSGCIQQEAGEGAEIEPIFYDEDGNPITQSLYSLIGPYEGVYYLSFVTTVTNTGEVDLTVEIETATPSELLEAYVSSTPKVIEPGESTTWESDLIPTAPYEGETIDFSITVKGSYVYAGETHYLTKSGSVSLVVEEDPVAGFDVSFTEEPEEPGEPECVIAADCEGNTHIDCVGEWECTDGNCAWECVEEPTEPECLSDGFGCTPSDDKCCGTCQGFIEKELVDTACEHPDNTATCPISSAGCRVDMVREGWPGTVAEEEWEPGEGHSINCNIGYDYLIYTETTAYRCVS